jgi:hypothetical protein
MPDFIDQEDGTVVMVHDDGSFDFLPEQQA